MCLLIAVRDSEVVGAKNGFPRGADMCTRRRILDTFGKQGKVLLSKDE